MVDIAAGMTMDQVVDILGPPLDRMDARELEIGSRAGRWRRRWPWRMWPGAARAEMSGEQYWLYKDVPEPGQIMNIAFENGMVVVVQVQQVGR